LSGTLGHRTTKTTETYYARRTNEAAILEAQKIWDRQPKTVEINPPLIDRKLDRMLGHRTTKTTETYYARRTNEAAILEAQKIWDRQPKPVEINPPLIDRKLDRTGYA